MIQQAIGSSHDAALLPLIALQGIRPWWQQLPLAPHLRQQRAGLAWGCCSSNSGFMAGELVMVASSALHDCGSFRLAHEGVLQVGGMG
jgi:hypothetical protein